MKLFHRRGRVLVVVALTMIPFSGAAQDLRGPTLGAASNFGQGFLPDLLDRALANGVTDFRDAVYWDRVENASREYVFETETTLYPDLLDDAGVVMSLTVNNGHPAYDAGGTPLSADAVNAFANHAAATVARFAAIEAVEVGNEFNSANFVSGPLQDAGLNARAEAYVTLLKAVAARSKSVRPDVRIIGGGVHSIPTGYLQQLVDLGAADDMDSLALHPYATPIEHLSKQIAVMRRIPQLSDMPVEITEFGSQSPEQAAGTLMRSYCQYALAGASRIVWYGLNERGDDYVPLVTGDGMLTQAWRAFAFAQANFVGAPVQDVSPDAFTYACLFDDRKLIIWGMPRALQIRSDDVAVYTANGTPLVGDSHMFSETAPLILIAPDRLSFTDDLALGPQMVVADSYHDFTYPSPDEVVSPAGFERSVRNGTLDLPMTTMPGQDKDGRPWTPWLGIRDNADVRLLPLQLTPSGDSTAPVSIVHRFTAPEDMILDVSAAFTPAERSADGVDVVFTMNGSVQEAWSGKEPVAYTADGLALAAGEMLAFIVSPGETATGDVTDYRITLRRSQD